MIPGCNPFISLKLMRARSPPLRWHHSMPTTLPCLCLWATNDTVIPVEFVACNDRRVSTGLQHVFLIRLNNLSFFCRRSISAQCGHASPAPDPHAPPIVIT
jgi:hypothetical protein